MRVGKLRREAFVSEFVQLASVYRHCHRRIIFSLYEKLICVIDVVEKEYQIKLGI